MNYIVDNNNLADFNRKMKTGNMIVWYFAPWCGHCKHMESEWDKFVTFKNNHPVLRKSLNCARVSDSILPHLENKYKGISGFPSIKFYRKGNETPNGEFQSDKERTSENFAEFSLNNLNSVNQESHSQLPSLKHLLESDSSESENNSPRKRRRLGSKKKRGSKRGSRRSKGNKRKGKKIKGSRKK
jgi:protein disulfide-isomerase A6